jgi:PKD repeat protein
MNYRSVVLPAFILLSMLPLAGCDKATPVAPNGTILAISANPTKIGINGTSTITVIGRKPDGNPLNPGTEIRLTASLGSIDTIVTTNSSGTATAIFRANGVLGTATIVAATGTGSTTGGGSTSDPGGSTAGTTASIAVQVGTAAGSIVLQPTPPSLTVAGGQVNLLALVRDANGQPLAGQGVNFTTDYGRLASRGAIVLTNASGVARDTLTLSASDLTGNVASVMVGAETTGAGSSGSTLLSATATIHIQGGPPVAHFTYARGGTANTVNFTSTSTGGQGGLTYTWDFGDGVSGNGAVVNHVYAAAGTYNVQLVVVDGSGQTTSVTAQITVPVPTGGGSSP